MQGSVSRHQVLLVVILALLTSSCAIFRNKVDTACVAEFASHYPDQKSAHFVLPWKVGESYKLTQGNCTLYTHRVVDNQHMAFDFKMPIGTPIHAAAAGKVVLMVERFRDDVDDDFHQANYIAIRHDGEFLSHYGHLTFSGAAVKVGQDVSQGELIGYSGNTGRSDYPHLHFFVQRLTDDCANNSKKKDRRVVCPQVPVAFSNAYPEEAVLREGETYTAKPY